MVIQIVSIKCKEEGNKVLKEVFGVEMKQKLHLLFCLEEVILF